MSASHDNADAEREVSLWLVMTQSGHSR